MQALEIRGLEKSFGSCPVIKGLDLVVPEHCVFGFLGPNGAGKTTTMKIVLGLLKADAGEIRVFGEKVSYGNSRTNRCIGYLPDVPEFYGYMRPMEYLALCAEVTGIPREEGKQRSRELLELAGLGGMKRKIGGFSRGMKQRLGIAQALLNKPQLLICDEPTSALDPTGRKEVLDILEQVKEETTVLFSTHILSDVERICSQVAVLYDGVSVLEGGLEELKAKRRKNSLELVFRKKEEMDALLACEDCRILFDSAEQKGAQAVLQIKGNLEEAEQKLLYLCAREQLLPVRLEVMEPTLESLFLEVVR